MSVGPWRQQRLTDNGLQPAEEQAAATWVDRFRQLSAKGPETKMCCYCGGASHSLSSQLKHLRDTVYQY